MSSTSHRNRRTALVFVVALAACGRPAPVGPVRASSPGPPPRPAAAPSLLERGPLPPPGAVAGARLEGGGTHAYALDLAAGRYVELVVDQKGIDVNVRVLDPAGSTAATVDSPNGSWGPEPIAFIAGRPGRYRLEVRSLSAADEAGRYAVRDLALRVPAPRDRVRADAERLLAAGEELRLRETGAGREASIGPEKQALALFRSIGEHRRVAEALVCLGWSHHDLGHTGAADAFYQEALAIFRSVGDDRRTASVLHLLAQNDRASGELEKAADRIRVALPLSQHQGDRWEEASLHNTLGNVYRDLGEVEKALDAYEKSLAGWRALRDREAENKTLSNLGTLYTWFGDPGKGLEDLRQALGILEAAGRRSEAAATLNSIGVACFLAGRPDEGLASLRRALQIHRQLGDRKGEAADLQNLGWARGRAGEPVEARRALLQALALFRDLGDPADEAATLTNLGDVETRSGQLREAVSRYRQALPLLAAVEDPSGEANALLGLARALRGQGDLAGALAASRQALTRVESLRRKPASYDLRSLFLASRQEHREFFIDLLMQLHHREPRAGYDARALAASEEARARSLLEMLADSGADLRQGVDPGLLAREAELSQQVNAADRRRRDLAARGASSGEVEAARTDLRQRLARYERVQAEIRRASPRYGAISQPHTLSAREIQRQIVDGDTLLLEFSLGRERSFLWAVTPGALASFELPPRAEIEEAARQAFGLLAAGRQTLARISAPEALARLSRLILQPAAGLLGHRRLLVVADGALQSIPFGALPAPAQAPGAGEPLIAGHEVVSLPSASTLAVQRRELRRRLPAPGALAVLADPVFDAGDPRVLKPAGAAASGGTKLRGAPGEPLAPLPSSRAEAKAILALAPPGESLSALDFAASRETVLSGRLKNYRILHFATHGSFDPDHPEMSWIALSMVDRRGRPTDGFLRAHEIYRLRLAADLVVLSACDTARGREVRGEGILGMTRSFMYAGARRVLVSLWPVEDHPTAELMRRFYTELLQHHTRPAAALRAAQTAMRRERGWESPYYWAGFVLQGD